METLKVLFLGPGGIGKTTLKKIFFEYANPVQLLNETLEPTYGAEISHYSLGTKIALYDLAGQQLTEWLTTASEIFIDTNLIFLILDSREEFSKNLEICQKLATIRINFCPSSIIAVFFHKVDLLMLEEFKELESKVQKQFPSELNMDLFLTSISENFFIQLYQNFTTILKKCINFFENMDSKITLLNIQIFSMFLQNKSILISDLQKKLEIPFEILQMSITQMQVKGIITHIGDTITLNKTGEEMIKNLESKITHRIKETITLERNYIRGLLLSDEFGKTFFIIETIPEFFKNLMTKTQGIPDPSLVAMFIGAIKDFGLTLDPSGFSTIQLSGENLQIISVIFQKIYGIFFINVPFIDSKLYSILKSFVQNIFEEFHEQIIHFLQSGAISNIQYLRQMMDMKVKELDNKIHEIIKSMKL